MNHLEETRRRHASDKIPFLFLLECEEVLDQVVDLGAVVAVSLGLLLTIETGDE